MKKLVIISHTEHQQAADGSFVGWGPTVNEINYLSNHWDQVIHIACLEKGVTVKGSSVGYINSNIYFESIPTFGGKRFWHKLDIIWKMPGILWKVQQSIKDASHVQLRVPMGIGVFLIPFFAFRKKSKYKFWIKYANNWGDLKPKLGFKFQRWLLKNNFANCKVTINGFWPNQPKHCISFENPCLYANEIVDARNFIRKKIFKQPFTFLFVGRLEDDKGVQIILNLLENLSPTIWEKMHFVGDGKSKASYLEQAEKFEGKIIFHGFVNRKQVHELYKESHFFLFPSYASEGFPKVIAEASAYGCIPVTSTVASIPHYITHGENGFYWDKWTQGDHFQCEINEEIKQNMRELATKFTFENYITHLREIFAIEEYL
jgi:glycosyltransferase involved in cell wall biosynthesis